MERPKPRAARKRSRENKQRRNILKAFTKSDTGFFINIAKEAGEWAFAYQREHISVSRKEDRSIVTTADLRVQEFLLDRISSQYPSFRFICEETPADRAILADDETSIIIDPIDGTAMYSMHLPIWCVSIGIFCGFKPAYGFVYSPGCGMMFHSDDDASYLNGTRLSVDKSIVIDNETNIFYSSEIRDIRINFPGKARNLGSTALHACLTTDNMRNRALAFIGRSFLWDWAGAIPVMEKAGVSVRYVDGRELDYAKIISNGYELEDYAVAYTCSDFSTIQKIFSR